MMNPMAVVCCQGERGRDMNGLTSSRQYGVGTAELIPRRKLPTGTEDPLSSCRRNNGDKRGTDPVRIVRYPCW